MFIKKLIDKDFFYKNGYIILDTNLENNQSFNKLVNEINNDLKIKLKNNKLSKSGGYIMGNLGIDQGPYGPQLYSLIFQDKFVKIYEDLIKTKLNLFNIFYGGNLVLPKKGNQHFHIDGSYTKKMFMISIATEDINLENGPTEICVGSHNKEIKFWKFFFSKKQKKKVLLKKGQILIRPHNLWHRGTKNNSSKPRLLLSFSLTPKTINNVYAPSPNLKILPNFFNSNFIGRLQEFSYVYLGSIRLIFKLLVSIIKQK